MPDTLPGSFVSTDEILSVVTDIAGDENDVLRLAAVQAAGALPGAATTDLLLTALKDPDDDIRVDAVMALADRDDPRIGAALAGVLADDPCPDARVAAVRALARHPLPDLVPTLRGFVTVRPDDMGMDMETSDEGWDDWLDLQIAAIEALAAWRTDDAMGDFIAALEDPEGQDLTGVVVPVLANLGPSGLSALLDLSRRAGGRRLVAVIAALGRVDHPDAEARLVDLTASKAAAVRIDALAALAVLRPDHDRLRALYEDTTAEVRAAALARGPLTQDEALDRLLEEPRLSVRRAILKRFTVGGPLAEGAPLAAALVVHARHPHGETAAVAIDALAARAADTDIAVLREIATDRDAPEGARWAAVRGLGSRPQVAACIETLVELSDDPARPIRLEAVAALGRCLDSRPVAVQALLSVVFPDGKGTAADEPSPADAPAGQPPETMAALEETGLAHDSGAQSTLGSILGAEEFAQDVLAEAETAPTPGLSDEDLAFLALAKRAKRGRRRVTLDGDEAATDDARLLAIRLLGDARDEAVPFALVTVLSADPDDLPARRAAAAALARHAHVTGEPLPAPAVEVLLNAGRSEDVDLKRAACDALCMCRDDEPVHAWLQAALSDRDAVVRQVAMRGLVPAMPASDRLNSCIRAMADPSAVVAGTGALLLAEIGGAEAVSRVVDWLMETNRTDPADTIVATLSRTAPGATRETLLTIARDTERRVDWPAALRMLAGSV